MSSGLKAPEIISKISSGPGGSVEERRGLFLAHFKNCERIPERRFPLDVTAIQGARIFTEVVVEHREDFPVEELRIVNVGGVYVIVQDIVLVAQKDRLHVYNSMWFQNQYRKRRVFPGQVFQGKIVRTYNGVDEISFDGEFVKSAS